MSKIKIIPRKNLTKEEPIDFPKYDVVYIEKENEDGTVGIEPIDKKSIIEEVQSFYDHVRIDKILERVAFGDYSALNNDGLYGVDLSSIPANAFEVADLFEKNKAKFDGLPNEVKAIFDNDIRKFADAIVNDSIEQFGKRFEKLEKGDDKQ